MSNIGRNDPCHCGSSKKYKKCCWPKDAAAAAQLPSADVAGAAADTAQASRRERVPARDKPKAMTAKGSRSAPLRRRAI